MPTSVFISSMIKINTVGSIILIIIVLIFYFPILFFLLKGGTTDSGIIERNNEINTEKHKNDPSWSVIVVAYLPLCDKYSNYIRKKENERERKMKSDRQKELDKI